MVHATECLWWRLKPGSRLDRLADLHQGADRQRGEQEAHCLPARTSSRAPLCLPCP